MTENVINQLLKYDQKASEHMQNGAPALCYGNSVYGSISIGNHMDEMRVLFGKKLHGGMKIARG